VGCTNSISVLCGEARGRSLGRGSVVVPVVGGFPVLVSFVYVVVCRVLEFVVLLVRDDRSKELEIVVLNRSGNVAGSKP
jgi:hypothetical protein